jgi:SulP family sulfate permease
VPFTVWWSRVTPDTLSRDAAATFTGAEIVLPPAVAFATVAGLLPQ